MSLDQELTVAERELKAINNQMRPYWEEREIIYEQMWETYGGQPMPGRPIRIKLGHDKTRVALYQTLDELNREYAELTEQKRVIKAHRDQLERELKAAIKNRNKKPEPQPKKPKPQGDLF
jgi:hypothetical protein